MFALTPGGVRVDGAMLTTFNVQIRWGSPYQCSIFHWSLVLLVSSLKRWCFPSNIDNQKAFKASYLTGIAG